jgi:large subunit ribosomal protein L31
MRTDNGCPPSVTKERFVNQQPLLHDVDVRCAACGTSFAIRSTAEAISVDVCSTCHPAYTGRERTAASGGRIDRFNTRRALAAA